MATASENKLANGSGNGSAMVLPWVFAGVGMLGAVVVFVWGQINPKQDIGDIKKEFMDQLSQVDHRSRETDTELKRLLEE
jgi:hypothetical protein